MIKLINEFYLLCLLALISLFVFCGANTVPFSGSCPMLLLTGGGEMLAHQWTKNGMEGRGGEIVQKWGRGWKGQKIRERSCWKQNA